MTMFLLRFGAIGVVAGLAAALAAHDQAFFNSRENVGLATIALILFGAILFRKKRSQSQALSSRSHKLMAATTVLGVWFLIAGLFFWVYDQRDMLHRGVLSVMSAVHPGLPIMLDGESVIVTRDRSGHFVAEVSIADQTMRMLVDTGSSDLALPYEVAEAIGIDVEALDFEHPVMTANGQAKVAAVKLETVSVGTVTLNRVQASVSEPGRLASPLLGMSFLGRLTEVNLHGDKMILVR